MKHMRAERPITSPATPPAEILPLGSEVPELKLDVTFLEEQTPL